MRTGIDQEGQVLAEAILWLFLGVSLILAFSAGMRHERQRYAKMLGASPIVRSSSPIGAGP
jgi:hypothetical protein